MIREDLLEFRYYLERLSKFMRESYGISEQVQTFWSLLKQVDSYYDSFFSDLQIFGESHPKGKVLDNLGSIFGCQRKFTIPIYKDYEPGDTSFFSIKEWKQISLTDDEFLTFIKTQIIKQNFDGTRENLQKLYSTYEDGKIKKGYIDLRFLYMTDPDASSPSCRIAWDFENPSESMRLLFEQGYLTIESVGILYRRGIYDFTNIAKYANPIYAKGKSESGGPDYIITASANADPTWDASEEYALLSSDGSYYRILKNKPTNWDNIYSSVTIIEIEEAPSSHEGEVWHLEESPKNQYRSSSFSVLQSIPDDWASGTYYENKGAAGSQWESGISYAATNGLQCLDNKPVGWENLYQGYVKMGKKQKDAEFEQNRFYAKVITGGVYS